MITHESFLRIAKEIASNSKATRLKVGAVLVDMNNHIIGTGYNGCPKGSNYDLEGWRYNGNTKTTFIDKHHTITEPVKETYSHKYVIHAELNAILNATTSDLSGCKLYCTHNPCIHCASIIAQKQISHVYYNELYRDISGINFLRDHKIFIQQINL